MPDSFEMDKATEPEDHEEKLLEYAIHFALTGSYPPLDDLTSEKRKDRKRAIRRKAATLIVEKGEVYLQRQHRRVKAITTKDEQKRILHACHCEPTSGYFGITKTWRRVAERFYWRGLCDDVKELVSLVVSTIWMGV